MANGIKSVGIAFIWNDHILLEHHPKSNKFKRTLSIPKGGQHDNEIGADFLTAYRELKEELNLDIPIAWIIDAPKHSVFNSEGREIVYFIIKIDKLSELNMTEKILNPINYQREEVDWAGFMTFEEAWENMLPYQRDILKKVGYNKFSEGGLVAPNGKPSNLTPEQHKLVRTPEFKAWFGDWENDPQNASKVVDENGEPLVVYHGSPEIFSVFDISKVGKSTDTGMWGKGFYFTSNKDYAEKYTVRNYKKGMLTTVFLAIKKPYYIRKQSDIPKINVPEETMEDLANSDEKYSHIFRENLITQGYEGVIVPEKLYNRDNNYLEIVAFEPTQIKLADGSNTTFDGSNPDIRFSGGGDVRPFTDDGNKLVVFSQYRNYTPYKIAVDNINDADYITLWKTDIDTGKDKKVGALKLNEMSDNFLKVSEIGIDKGSQGLGLGLEMYKVALKYSSDKIKGIRSYLPDRSNKKQVPKIYKKLNSVVEGDWDVIYKNSNPDIRFDDGGAIKTTYKYSKEFNGITIYTNETQEYIGEMYSPFEAKGSFKATVRKGDLENIAIESEDLKKFNFKWGEDNWLSIVKKLKSQHINELELFKVGKFVHTFELKPIKSNPDIRLDGGGEVDKETYKKWKSLVNMSKSELEKFYNSQEGKEAGMSTSDAKEQGISSGRESARWIIKMKDTPVSDWTPSMWMWAKKQISFISRMNGNKGSLYDDKGNKTRKHTSLLIWGHNPNKKKYDLGGDINPTYSNESDIKAYQQALSISYSDGGEAKPKKVYVSIRLDSERKEIGVDDTVFKNSIYYRYFDKKTFIELKSGKLEGLIGVSSSPNNIAEWFIYRDCLIVMNYDEFIALNETETINYYDPYQLMKNNLFLFRRLYHNVTRHSEHEGSFTQTLIKICERITPEITLEMNVSSGQKSSELYRISRFLSPYETKAFQNWIENNSIQIESPIDLTNAILDFNKLYDSYLGSGFESPVLTFNELLPIVEKGITNASRVYESEQEIVLTNKQLNIPKNSQLFFIAINESDSNDKSNRNEYIEQYGLKDLYKVYFVNRVDLEKYRSIWLNKSQENFDKKLGQGRQELELKKQEVGKQLLYMFLDKSINSFKHEIEKEILVYSDSLLFYDTESEDYLEQNWYSIFLVQRIVNKYIEVVKNNWDIFITQKTVGELNLYSFSQFSQQADNDLKDYFETNKNELEKINDFKNVDGNGFLSLHFITWNLKKSLYDYEDSPQWISYKQLSKMYLEKMGRDIYRYYDKKDLPLISEYKDGGETDEPTHFWGKEAGGVLVYCSTTDRYLILLRSKYVLEPNTWGIISGKLDDNETNIEDAVLREAKEETGQKLGFLIPSFIFEKPNFKFHNFVSIVEEEFTPELDWENSDFKWVKLNEMPENLHFGLKLLIQKEDLPTLVKGAKQEKFKNGGLVAPNGKPSNLTPEQYKLVRTPEFKTWFGDWENDPQSASKVIDENGEPLVVYHGTTLGDFNIFKSEIIFFAKDKNIAKNQYSTINSLGHFSSKSKVFEVFLNLRNPYIFDAKNKDYSELNHKFKGEEYDVLDDLSKEIKNNYNTEYDGLIVLNIDEEQMFGTFGKKAITDDFVCFEPIQIKLADGSNATFDGDNPDIRYSEGGLVAPNGKPSNLTPEQHKLVRTPEFKAWFGDWENDPKNSSKVIDENGEPLVCYHGQFKGGKIKVFDSYTVNSYGGFNRFGYWFTNSLEYAKAYATTDFSNRTYHNIYECFLNIRNGWELNGTTGFDELVKRFVFKTNVKEIASAKKQDNDKFKKYLKMSNKDGVFISKFDGDKGYAEYYGAENYQEVYIALYPNQIKLADGSNTTFDGSNPDIRFDGGGDVKKNQDFIIFREEFFTHRIAGRLANIRGFSKKNGDEKINDLSEKLSLLLSKKEAYLQGKGIIDELYLLAQKIDENIGLKTSLGKTYNSIIKRDIFAIKDIYYNIDEEAIPLFNEKQPNTGFSEGGKIDSVHYKDGDIKLALSEHWYDDDSGVELVPVSELIKFKEFDRNETPKYNQQQSKETISHLSDSFKTEGIREPLIIEYSATDKSVLLIEGNHRLNSAIELGIDYLPARVVLRKSAFPSIQEQKSMNVTGVTADRSGYIRSSLKPSSVGIANTTPIFEQGGIIEGRLHSECGEDGCGRKFEVGETGTVIEAERDEAVIVSTAFNDNEVKKIKGTPSEIASALNVLGGGKSFDKGAEVFDSNEKPVNVPELKTQASNTDVEDDIEGGSIIINRRSMADEKEYEVKGTPRQIASAINSINGNGVKIEDGATIK
jgi:8-oxo-dGTP pyrophosphatase MutT (NUDIX family)